MQPLLPRRLLLAAVLSCLMVHNSCHLEPAVYTCIWGMCQVMATLQGKEMFGVRRVVVVQGRAVLGA